MLPRHTVLEQVIRRVPFALLASDITTGTLVNAGLRLTARPYSRGFPVIEAQRAPVSGNLGFYSLPNLRTYEHGEAALEDFCPDSANPNYLLLIEDAQGRYLPQVIALCLPYGVKNSSGVWEAKAFETMLFSSPARPTAGPSYGLIRGELWDSTNQRPAAWALISAQTSDRASGGIALSDARGMFALFIAYPKPGTANTPLNQQSWTLDISVRYQPSARVHHASAPPGAPPDQRSILAQAAATFTEGGAATTALDLSYGAAAILKTQPAAEPEDGRAWITPAPPGP